MSEEYRELTEEEESQAALASAAGTTNRLYDIWLEENDNFKEVVVTDVNLPREVASFVENQFLKSKNLTETLLAIISKNEDALESLSQWRESPDCLKSIQRDEEENFDFGKYNPFMEFFSTEQQPNVRAEIIAFFELYCEAGWAAKDVQNNLLSKTFNEMRNRVAELFVPLSMKADVDQRKVPFATDSGEQIKFGSCTGREEFYFGIPDANKPSLFHFAIVTTIKRQEQQNMMKAAKLHRAVKNSVGDGLLTNRLDGTVFETVKGYVFHPPIV